MKKFGLKRFGGKSDLDFDGIKNRKDCQPRNTMRQDMNGPRPQNQQSQKYFSIDSKTPGMTGGYVNRPGYKEMQERVNPKIQTSISKVEKQNNQQYEMQKIDKNNKLITIKYGGRDKYHPYTRKIRR